MQHYASHTDTIFHFWFFFCIKCLVTEIIVLLGFLCSIDRLNYNPDETQMWLVNPLRLSFTIRFNFKLYHPFIVKIWSLSSPARARNSSRIILKWFKNDLYLNNLSHLATYSMTEFTMDACLSQCSMYLFEVIFVALNSPWLSVMFASHAFFANYLLNSLILSLFVKIFVAEDEDLANKSILQ